MVVRVSFENSSRHYDYLCNSVKVSVGDYVVVPTGLSGYGVAKVERLGKSSSRATKHVVQRVDIEAYKAMLKALEVENENTEH